MLPYYRVKSEGAKVRELSEQLLTVARKQDEPSMLAVAHGALAASLVWSGELESARAHGEESFAIGAEKYLDPVLRFSDAVPWLALALWGLGFPKQARLVADEGISDARATKNPLAMALSLTLGWDL